MIICHSISDDPQYAGNSNFNTAEEVLDSEGPISLDGVYRNVYERRGLIAGRGGIMFVTGDYVGLDNTFDTGQPLMRFCNLWQLNVLLDLGFEMGWHTWSHPDLTKCTDDQVRMELSNPFGYKHFAYPYGKHDERVRRLVEEAGYENAWVLGNGDDSQFQRRRWHI